VYDTAMAFYACMDVNVRSGSPGANAGTTAVDTGTRSVGGRLLAM
jgi:predicted carbohydrate-binding protein with CBM5 and CBM33 domain